MLKFSEFLLEDRIGFLKSKYEKGINTEHDEHAQHRDAESVINHLANKADPSSNKVHTQWLADKYNKGQFRQEDHEQVHDTLKHFDKYKPKLEKKDINQYGSLEEVDHAIRPHIGSAVTRKEKAEEIVNSGIHKVHDDGHNQVFHVKTKEASKDIYGGGSKAGGTHTNWCTASRSDSNMFDQYNKNGGKLYTFHIANDENSPYQMHMKNADHVGEFSDRHNHSATNKLGEIVGKIGGIQNHPEFTGKHPVFDGPEKIIKHVQEYKNHTYINKALSSVDTIPEHIRKEVADKAADHFNKEPEHKGTQDVIRTIASSSHTHADTLEKYAKNPEIRKSYGPVLADNHNINKETGNILASNPNYHHQLSSNPSTHAETISKMLGEMKNYASSNYIRTNISLHHNLSKEDASTMLAGKDANLHHNILSNTAHKDLMDHHVKDPTLHSAISVNPHTSPDTLRKIHSASTERPWIHENLANNKSTPTDILKSLSQHPDKDVKKAATKTLKALKVR